MSGASVLTERRIIFNAVTLKTAVYVAMTVSMAATVLIAILSIGHASVVSHVANAVQALACVAVIIALRSGKYCLLFLYVFSGYFTGVITNLHTLPSIVGTGQTWVHLAKNVSANGTLQPWGLWEVFEANEDICRHVRNYSLLLTVVLNAHLAVAVACWWIVLFTAGKIALAVNVGASTRLLSGSSAVGQRLTHISKHIGRRIGGPYGTVLSDKRVFINSIPLLLALTVVISVEMLSDAWLALSELFNCPSCTLQSAYGCLFELIICASVFYGVRKGSAPVLGVYLVFNLFDAVYFQYGLRPKTLYWILPRDALLGDPNAKVERAVRSEFHSLVALETYYLVSAGCAWLVVFIAYRTMNTTPLPTYQMHISAFNASVGDDSGAADGGAKRGHGSHDTGTSDKPTATMTTAENGSSKTKLVDAMVV